MSEIKRYYADIHGSMWEHKDGEYVLYSDYEAAERKIEALEALLKTIRPKADAYDGVCRTLGIDDDILGYCERNEVLLKAVRECYEKWKDNPCDETEDFNEHYQQLKSLAEDCWQVIEKIGEAGGK